jgi:hypothetical protein
MADSVITQDGINAVHFTYGSGSLFALKYFMPIYDPRIDPNIHNTPPNDLDPLSTYELSATVPVSATHGNIFGERIFNLDGNEISETSFYLHRIDGEGILTNVGTSAILTGISQTKPIQVNLVNGLAPSFTSTTSVQVISGTNIEGSNGTFTIENYGIVPQFNENTAGELSDRLFKVHSFAPAIGGTVSADRGQYTAVLDGSVGNFKFNKIAFYVQKVNSDFTDYIGSDPILFCMTPISSVAVKTSGAELDELGNYGSIGVDGMSRVDHVLELEFSTEQTLTNTSYQLVDYWTELPAIYSKGVYHMGDVVVGSSAIDGSYDPLGHLTSYDQDKAQLALAYSVSAATFFKTEEAGYLHISTSGDDNANLDFGDNNTLTGKKSFIFGDDNVNNGISSVAFGNSHAIETSAYLSVAFGYNNEMSGEYSFMINSSNRCEGDYAFASGYHSGIGKHAHYSFLLGGVNNQNHAENTMTGGTSNSNYSISSLVVGSYNILGEIGDVSDDVDTNACNFVSGRLNTVKANASGVFGTLNTVTDGTTGSLIYGTSNQNRASINNLIGGKNNISESNNSNSFITGINNVSNIYSSILNGHSVSASGAYSYVGGAISTVASFSSVVVTTECIVDVSYSLITGYQTSAVGSFITAGGASNFIDATHSFVHGEGNTLYGYTNFIMGTENNITSASLAFDNAIFGNNNKIERSSLLTVPPAFNFISGLYNTLNYGLASAMFGMYNTTSGNYNFTFGNQGVNAGSNSLLGGVSSTITSGVNSSLVLGINCKAGKDGAQSVGNNTYAYGENSFAGGQDVKAASSQTFMFGKNIDDNVWNSTLPNVGIGSNLLFNFEETIQLSSGNMIAIGDNIETAAPGSVSFGSYLTTFGEKDINIGHGNDTGTYNDYDIGYGNIAIGLNNISRSRTNYGAVSIGADNTVNTYRSVALGVNNKINTDAFDSYIFGIDNEVYGYNSFAFGHTAYIKSTAYNAMVFNLNYTIENDIAVSNTFLFNSSTVSPIMNIRNAGSGSGVKVTLQNRIPGSTGPTAFGLAIENETGTKALPFGVDSLGHIWHDANTTKGYKQINGEKQWTNGGQLELGTYIDTGLSTSGNIGLDFEVLLLQNSTWANFDVNFVDTSGTAGNTFKLTNGDAGANPDGETWIKSTAEFKAADASFLQAIPTVASEGNFYTFNAQLCKTNDANGDPLPNWQIVVANIHGQFFQNTTQTARWNMTYRSIV